MGHMERWRVMCGGAFGTSEVENERIMMHNDA